MKELPNQSVNCCVTSPPYFGLRDYGVEGQLGAEPTPDEFVEALVRVFREVRRVLRDDGTVWLNLGDSYTSGGRTWRAPDSKDSKSGRSMSSRVDTPDGLKPKELIGIPWRVAFALQADGWYLRQDIIWHKPNPMPESVRDRCTKAHEYVFLLSKSPKYYYDHKASKEDAVKKDAQKSYHSPDNEKYKGVPDERWKHQFDGRTWGEAGKRNRRSVWSVPVRSYKGAHFATFPADLIEPCILAGCPEGGTVLDPFGGSGTTAGVAVTLGRNAVICELNPEYADLVPERVQWIRDYYVRKNN
ncbi:DNA-methyltransferase [Marinobacter sp. THAF197a]|uniref:DNA-methyltransferase n=1 Tax=unclassified Marinobacter TaxID=83889 RepID=UPI003A5D1EF3